MRRSRLAAALAAVVLLALMFAGVARAAFTRAAAVSQSISSVTLVAPASLAGSPSGRSVVLNWPPAPAPLMP